MSFLLVRRSVKLLRSVNKYRCFSVLCNNDHIKKNFQKTKNDITLRIIHTSPVVDKSVAFKLSDIGEGIREVVVKEWFVKVGDKVQQFDNICEVQSDKAAVTITSRYDGVVTKLYHEVDQTALVGMPLLDIEVQDDGSEESTSTSSTPETAAAPEPATSTSTPRHKILTTPAVRRIASQFQVDLTTIKATGKNGRVMKEDLLAYLNISAEKSNEVPTQAELEARTEKPQVVEEPQILEEDKIVPITGFMKAMVKSMTESMKIPHFGVSDEYDITQLVKARAELKPIAESYGVKLSYMPIIIKAASLCLTKHPKLNSSPDSTCDNIIYKASHNIGVAMDTPNGLVVPVIKNVQQKSILEITKELNTLQEKGAKGQLNLSDLTGGTFTISNIGIVGGTYTKPIIFSPQVSIGAIGKIQVLPRFDAAGNVIKAHILTVSWSADHRIIDGVTMTRFSQDMKGYLEQPYKLLLNL